MATIESGRDPVLDVLRAALARLRKQESCSARELWDDVRDVAADRGWGYFWWFGRPFDDPHEAVESALESLEALDLLSGIPAPDSNPRFKRWQIAEGWQPPGPPDRGDGDGGRTGDLGAPGTGDDDGEGGITEVLRHSMLFALDEDAFDRLVGSQFGSLEP